MLDPFREQKFSEILGKIFTAIVTSQFLNFNLMAILESGSKVTKTLERVIFGFHQVYRDLFRKTINEGNPHLKTFT